MRKIVLLICLIFLFNPAYAGDALSFIYINGSNNNDQKMKDWYETGVKQLHPVLRKQFIDNTTIKEYYSQFGGFKIKEEPVIFFWGDKSKKDLEVVKDQLDLSKAISSSGAYFARSLIAQCMHDAIWVQKSHNMLPILEELNETVKKEIDNGNDVVLFGYSAGTFVAYQYLLDKLIYIEPEKLFETLVTDKDILSFVKSHPMKKTCISALSYKYAGVGTISSEGHMLLNQNKEELKKNYLKIDEMTKKACVPEDRVKGVVNFASPLVLFYSDMSDENYEYNYYNKLLVKYILENGFTLLTINFREDPLGFPSNRNLTVKEIEKMMEFPIENPSGLVYDNSSVWSKRPFFMAHTAYWSARKIFSKAVVDTFVNGYRFQYDENYQKKVIKRNSKKSEL